MIPSCRHITASFVNRLSNRRRKSSSLSLHMIHKNTPLISKKVYNSTGLFYVSHFLKISNLGNVTVDILRNGCPILASRQMTTTHGKKILLTGKRNHTDKVSRELEFRRKSENKYIEYQSHISNWWKKTNAIKQWGCITVLCTDHHHLTIFTAS